MNFLLRIFLCAYIANLYSANNRNLEQKTVVIQNGPYLSIYAKVFALVEQIKQTQQEENKLKLFKHRQ